MLGIAGVVVLFSPWSIDWTDKGILYGHGILLLAAFSFALCICGARNMKWASSPLELLPWQLLVGTIPIVIFALMHSPVSIIEWNATSVSALLFSGILASGIGNFGATIVNKELPSITASLGFLGVPVSGVIFATVILDEPVTLPIKIALVLIPAGLICVALGARKLVERK